MHGAKRGSHSPPVVNVTRDAGRAQALAAELNLQLTDELGNQALRLEVSTQEVRLAGCLPREEGKKVRPVRSDLAGLVTSPAGGKRGDVPLYRAVLGRKKGPGRVVFDATGGLGRDAWLLAAIGCSLVLVEQEAVIFALLRDGLARAGITAQQVARRIRLIHAPAQEVLAQMRHDLLSGKGSRFPQPHVVYLDPFFHDLRKRKGACKRSLQVLRHLAGEGHIGEQREVLGLALQVALERVVVKRPKFSAPLPPGQGRLSHSIRGRGCRFDVYQ